MRRHARPGIKTVAVTAGYITPEARSATSIGPIDAANVDLKAFTEHVLSASSRSPASGPRAGDARLAAERDRRTWLEVTNAC
jgi:pyruvate-formate lyase-activating enzyme